MRAVLAEPFVAQLAEARQDVQGAFWKQLRFLLRNLRYPSTRRQEVSREWRSRALAGADHEAWRFYFTIDGDLYVMKSAREHPK